TPADVPLTWSPERASDDAGPAREPTHTPDGADTRKRTLKTDAVGSFHVHAFVDDNGNKKRDAGESGLILNVHIVKVEIMPGAGNNRIFARDTLFNDARSTAAFLIVDSGTTAGTAPGVNAAYTDALFPSYPLSVKVTVKLTGGGPDRRRGTADVNLGYIQQTTGDSIKGTYADGRTLKEVIAASAAIADPIVGGAPAMLAFPVRDTRGPSSSGTGPFIISSSDNDKSDIPAGGQKRVVRYLEPPAIAINKAHPVTGAALASISGSNDFAMFLCAFSNSFDENYTVLASSSWKITYGTYTALGGWTIAGAHTTAAGGMTVHSPPKKGSDTDVEHCPPNFVDNIKMDAR
ncbi:MAG: hypothetical protein ACJ79H_06750, partial [Myxococcales bacterium]